LAATSFNSSGQLQFSILGLSSGSFTVESTTDFSVWSEIYSGTVPNTNFVDLTSPPGPRRFYRVKTTWP
jgi:hypothetical protein